MTVTEAQVQKLLLGNFSFSLFSFSMLITRWRKVYMGNPSAETVQRCTDGLNEFFLKYAKDEKFAKIAAPDIDKIAAL